MFTRGLRTTVLRIALTILLGVLIWLEVRQSAQLLWFAVLLAVLGVAVLIVPSEAPGVLVLAAFLASLSVLFGGFYLASLAWFSAMSLFPFVFIHFALVFPVRTAWFERHARLVLALDYGSYLLLVGLVAGQAKLQIDPAIPIILVLLAFLVGLGLFAGHYLYALTPTEKNRLRVVLIGCLAGGVPFILSQTTSKDELLWLQTVALPLLPLFPVSLVLAVLKRNFADPGPAFQRGLVISLAGAGSISSFFATVLGFSLLLPGDYPWTVPLAAGVSGTLLFPLVRWSGAYVQAHFPFSVPSGALLGRQDYRQFGTISPNPFIVGNPVRTPEMFFGRSQDFEFMADKLRSQRQGCVVLLCGERRAGKTSILCQVLNGRLGPDFLPVFIDLQEMVVQSDAEFASALISRLESTAREAAPSVGFGDVDGYLGLSRLFDRLMQSLGETRLVMLFDEYELIDEKVRAGKLTVDIYRYLNSVLERHGRLSYVFAGSRFPEPSSESEALFAKSFVRDVSFLPLVDAQRLICAPLEEQVAFRPDAVSQILALTHGHPFYTQLICQSMVEVLNDTRSNLVTPEIVNQTVRRVLDNPPPQLLYKWSAFSVTQKLVLSGLATVLKDPSGFVPAERVERLLASLPDQHRESVDRAHIRIALEELRLLSVLDRDQNRYSFTMDLMRLFVRSERGIWNVLAELEASVSKGSRREKGVEGRKRTPGVPMDPR